MNDSVCGIMLWNDKCVGYLKLFQLQGVKNVKFDRTVICVVNEELNDLYSSPNTVRVIKSRRM